MQMSKATAIDTAHVALEQQLQGVQPGWTGTTLRQDGLAAVGKVDRQVIIRACRGSIRVCRLKGGAYYMSTMCVQLRTVPWKRGGGPDLIRRHHLRLCPIVPSKTNKNESRQRQRKPSSALYNAYQF